MSIHRQSVLVAVVLVTSCGSAWSQEGEPAQPVLPAVVPGAVVGPPLTPEEIADLKATFEALSKEQQEEMRAYYKDLGIDLDVALGFTSARTVEAQRTQELVMAMKSMDFARTPQAVLAARSKLGFGQVPHPNPQTARGADIAKWIHVQVMAGEWQEFGEFVRGRPESEADAIYSAVLQGLNKGNSGLLPEEVLAVADACPAEPKPWQITALSSMLRAASDRNSPGPMLAQVKAGTRLFGNKDAAASRRTVEFLAGAGLVVEAYAYLPSLEQARKDGDGKLILVHGQYQEQLASQVPEGPEAEGHRRAAWDLYCEVSLLERESSETRREALKHAVDLMIRMPRAQVAPWLAKVFASDTLGPVALELMALNAVAIGNAKLDVEQRAQAILSLKEAVDVLLARPSLDASALRVPMRMFTTALVTEIENAVKDKSKQRVIAREAQLLLRAVPSQQWFAALEPSLATRASKACIAIATMADEIDQALALLSDAVKRTPDQGIEIADVFLKAWEDRLSPKSEQDDNQMMFYFYREYLPAAPLTRGRQRRNLDRLHRLLETLQAIGVESRQIPEITPAFKACHSKTEVYAKEDIVRVFGPVEKMPAATSTALATAMAASLNGDWRNRAVQRSNGTKRTDTEIAQLVDKGYGLALELIEVSIAAEPDSWKTAAIKAGLSYDRMQFKQQQQKDAIKQNEYRQAAFGAFEQAALRYAKAIESGQEREDSDVYIRWFGAAMGTAELNFLNADEMPVEGSAQDDQIGRIKKAIAALPADAAFRHISDFARAMGSAVGRSDPEVKPRLVKHALRIIGEHPAGASLRSLDELYRDLVKDEIKLRLTLDGEDRVGVGKPFAMMISLRFTNSVDRETGGFAKYLQNNIYARVGRQYREVNYRDEFQKGIETSLNKSFTIEAIGFFDPFMPARGVTENGEDGWLEKPMAYAIVTRKDPTIDRVPQVSMDMQFEDQTGPVTLAIPSNTPPLALAADRIDRPCLEMKVAQIVDVRDAREGGKDRSIKLEVQIRGKGVVPDIRECLVGLDGAIDGYTIAEGGIEARPPVVLQEGEATSGRFYSGAPKPPKGGYQEADENGLYRLSVERTWMVTYTPGSGALGNSFRVPTLKDGVKGALESRYYSDMDIVPVSGTTVAVDPRVLTPLRLTLASLGILAAVGIGVLAYRRLRSRPVEAAAALVPANLTPLSAVVTLQRILNERGLDQPARESLQRDLADLEQRYFGPESNSRANGDLEAVVRRWATAAGRTSA